MSDITINIRSNDEGYVKGRRRDLINAGFQVSLVGMEPDPEHQVYTFDLYVDFNDAHKLPRGDDRWKAANIFFQRAEAAEARTGAYSGLATDWSTFGYEDSTLYEYLQLVRYR